MAGHTPEAIHTEIWTDPVSYHGSQDSIDIYLQSMTAIRDDTDARPITVNIRIPSQVGPGVVSEPLITQPLRDSIVESEYVLNCFPEAGDDTIVINQKEALRDWIALLFNAPPESLYAFTDEFQAQMLATFTNALWPATRTTLLALTSRWGSRSEELFGEQVTRADMDAGYQYGLTQGQDWINKP